MTTTALEAAHAVKARRKMVLAVFASAAGWALDLFDLFILLYVAPTIGRLFFPSASPTLSLAAVYASFAVTLLMRPVGAALFGSYADRHGRKGAMIRAVVGVGITTALFGAMPTIQQIGVAAPVMFLCLRLVQGVFVGGVVASTHTIGTESVPLYWRGAMSGLVGGGGAGLGALLASFVFFAASAAFPGSAFEVWGWRAMFFSGILSSFLGLVIFNGLEESPIWASLKARAQSGGPAMARSPLRSLFAPPYFNVFLINLLMTIGGGAGYYLTLGFLPTYLKVVNKLSNEQASLILITTSVLAIFASIAVGHLSTFIGRKRTFILFGIVRIVALPLLVLAMSGTADVILIAVYALLLAFLGNGGYAPVLIFLNERFPTSLRSSGTGLSWNVGFAIGGILPTFVSLTAATPADLPRSLAIFLTGISVIYLIGAFIIPETKSELV